MLKSNGLLVLLAFVAITALSACCCCHDDEDDACPDLIVQEIDLNTLSVDCPTGAGSCVTTVSFTVANIGTADAGPFNIRIVADPNVVLNEFVPGLDAGDSLTITIMTPPGDNCFNPDCTIAVAVDIDDQVEECDESNNRLAETLLG